MQILQLAKVDGDRRLTLHKETLEAVNIERGDEFIVYKNDSGRLTLAPAQDVESLMEG